MLMALPEVFQKVCGANGWACDGNQVRIGLDGNRTQGVALDAFEHGNDRMIRAYSVIGESEALTETRLRSALSLNFGLPHGALAITSGKLVLTDTFVAEDADAGEVEASLRFIAGMADRYERLIYGTDKH